MSLWQWIAVLDPVLIAVLDTVLIAVLDPVLIRISSIRKQLASVFVFSGFS
jgi:hypothetical protein